MTLFTIVAIIVILVCGHLDRRQYEARIRKLQQELETCDNLISLSEEKFEEIKRLLPDEFVVFDCEIIDEEVTSHEGEWMGPFSRHHLN